MEDPGEEQELYVVVQELWLFALLQAEYVLFKTSGRWRLRVKSMGPVKYIFTPRSSRGSVLQRQHLEEYTTSVNP